MESGAMAPYRFDEYPAKLDAMISLYESWYGHFQMLAHKRDRGGADGLSAIEAFRARERR